MKSVKKHAFVPRVAASGMNIDALPFAHLLPPLCCWRTPVTRSHSTSAASEPCPALEPLGSCELVHHTTVALVPPDDAWPRSRRRLEPLSSNVSRARCKAPSLTYDVFTSFPAGQRYRQPVNFCATEVSGAGHHTPTCSTLL